MLSVSTVSTVSIGKRNKSKLEHIQSIEIKSETSNGDYKDALVTFFLNCAERDGALKLNEYRKEPNQ